MPLGISESMNFRDAERSRAEAPEVPRARFGEAGGEVETIDVGAIEGGLKALLLGKD